MFTVPTRFVLNRIVFNFLVLRPFIVKFSKWFEQRIAWIYWKWFRTLSFSQNLTPRFQNILLETGCKKYASVQWIHQKISYRAGWKWIHIIFRRILLWEVKSKGILNLQNLSKTYEQWQNKFHSKYSKEKNYINSLFISFIEAKKKIKINTTEKN